MQDHNYHDRPVLELIPSERFPDRTPFDKASHWPRYVAFALMALMMAVSIYLFLSTNQILARFQGSLSEVEDNDAKRIQFYNEKLEALQDRMTVFVADSVETKLKALEKNVTSGTVGTQEIKTLEELKGEVKLLQNYSTGKRGNLTDPARLDHARFQVTPGTQNVTSSGDLLYEVSQMKRLLYLSIASCGFVGLMIGGYWWHSATRIRRLAVHKSSHPLLVGKAERDL